MFLNKIRYFLAVAAVLLLVSCSSVLNVGFDLDDTLVFSTPAFEEGFSAECRSFSDQFWVIVNKSEITESMIKKKATEILREIMRK